MLLHVFLAIGVARAETVDRRYMANPAMLPVTPTAADPFTSTLLRVVVWIEREGHDWIGSVRRAHKDQSPARAARAMRINHSANATGVRRRCWAEQILIPGGTAQPFDLYRFGVAWVLERKPEHQWVGSRAAGPGPVCIRPTRYSHVLLRATWPQST